jgi:peptide/nickel transport system permease protein
MTEEALPIAKGKVRKRLREVEERTYWQAVWYQLSRDRIAIGAALTLVFIALLAVAAPWIGDRILGYNPNKINLDEEFAPPTWVKVGLGACLSGERACHWLGTDDVGRDVLTRAIYAGRVSLSIGLAVAVVSMTIGVLLGLVSGFYGGQLIDDIINAVIQTLRNIPTMFLLMMLVLLYSPSPLLLAVFIGVLGWMGTARLIRGQVFSVREREYVIAARSIGASNWRIILRHILPNVSSMVIVIATFDVAGAILVESGLSYLGVGIQPPTASWGNMLQGSISYINKAPWLVAAPGLFIFLATLSIFLLGDGLRDALDPWLKE